jgi:hypothetical protein
LQVVPLLEKYKVDTFLAGHDHDLEHIRKTAGDDNDIDYIISGAGSKAVLDKYSAKKEETINKLGYSSLFFRDQHGFVGITIEKQFMMVEYLTYEAEDENVVMHRIYHFTRMHRGWKIYDSYTFYWMITVVVFVVLHAFGGLVFMVCRKRVTLQNKQQD